MVVGTVASQAPRKPSGSTLPEHVTMSGMLQPLKKRNKVDTTHGWVDWKGARDKKLRRNLKVLDSKYQVAAQKARDTDVLLENTSGKFSICACARQS
jgi:hypothetical protein